MSDGTATWRRLWEQTAAVVGRQHARWLCEEASAAFESTLEGFAAAEGLSDGQVKSAMAGFVGETLRCFPPGTPSGRIHAALTVGCDGRVMIHGGAYPHRGPIEVLDRNHRGGVGFAEHLHSPPLVGNR